MLKVPHPITPAHVIELVTQIKEAERLTVWDSENNIPVQTRSLKIQWEGSKLPPYIDLGILGRYETNLFIKGPVRCYKCQRLNHTSSICHARQDTCGLCGGRYRTSICVAKRKADVVVLLKCSNCKGDHCTASAKCPYRREIVRRMRPAQQTQSTESAQPAKPAWTASIPVCQTVNTPSISKQIPHVTTDANHGRLPKYITSSRGQNKQEYDRSNTQVSTSTTQSDSQYETRVGGTDTTEETQPLRRMEGADHTETNEQATHNCTSPQTATPQTCRNTSGTTTVNKSTTPHPQLSSSTQQHNTSRVSDVGQRYSSNESAHHDNAATANEPDGRYPTKQVHSQHNESHLTEHGRDNTEIRILH